jgi:hypothetical protein
MFYSLIVFLGAILMLIILYLIQLALPRRARSLIEVYVVHPMTWKKFIFTLRDTGDVEPTRGQAIYLLFILILNAALSGVKLYPQNGTLQWNNPLATFAASLSNRLGALSVANIPLMVFYSGRNNLLLLVTGSSTVSSVCLF